MINFINLLYQYPRRDATSIDKNQTGFCTEEVEVDALTDLIYTESTPEKTVLCRRMWKGYGNYVVRI